MTRNEFVEKFGFKYEGYKKVQNSGNQKLIATYGMIFAKGESSTSDEVRNQVADELRKLVAQC